MRDPKTGRPKLEVLYHFGRAEQLDQEGLRRLVKSISKYLDPEHAAEALNLAGIAPEIEPLGVKAIEEWVARDVLVPGLETVTSTVVKQLVAGGSTPGK